MGLAEGGFSSFCNGVDVWGCHRIKLQWRRSEHAKGLCGFCINLVGFKLIACLCA